MCGGGHLGRELTSRCLPLAALLELLEVATELAHVITCRPQLDADDHLGVVEFPHSADLRFTHDPLRHGVARWLPRLGADLILCSDRAPVFFEEVLTVGETPVGQVRSHAWREATTMSLYTAIVLLAVLVGLGQGDRGDDLAVIWGVSIGLGLAHVFAFNVAAVIAAGGEFTDDDRSSTIGILGAVAGTAGVASAAYLFWEDADSASTAAAIVLAVVMGLSLYIDARSAGASNRRSLAFTATTLAVALVVVGVKIYLP